MSASLAPPPRLRLGFLLLASVLVGLTLSSFYRFGSTATDENLFTTPPGPVYLDASIGTPPEAVPAGSFIVRVGDQPVRRFADWSRALESLPPAGSIRIGYAPDTDRSARIERLVPAEAVRAAQVSDASAAALVIAVTAGGASDRAGMRVGDLIVRIGGRPFSGIFEADALMRGGGVGRSYGYDVLRAGRPVTLQIVLARFGVQLSTLFWYVAGLAWMAFGAWLLWVRATVKGARLLGLAFLLTGYGLSVLLLRRDAGMGPAYVLQTAIPALGVLLGVALFSHASVFFPREWPTLSRARWLPAALYGTAVATWVLLGQRPSDLLFLTGIAVLATAGSVVRRLYARERPPDDRDVRRWVSSAGIASALVGGVTLGLRIAFANIGLPPPAALWLAVCLAAFPLAHLYTIGRYRVFDLQLRVRRNVQYSVVSFVWAAVPFAVLLGFLWWLPQLDLRLPRVRVTSSSIEVMEAPPAPPLPPAPSRPGAGMGDDARDLPAAPGGGLPHLALNPSSSGPFEKGVLMVLAIALAFGLREIGIRGQRVLASRFHRGGYDYRLAAQAIGEVSSTRLDLAGLTAGVLDALVRLLPLKRAGLLLAHGSRTYCADRAHGFDEVAWRGFCRASADDVLAAMRDARGELSAEYAPARLGDALRAAELGYVYPLRSRDALVGVIFLGEKESESAFQNADFEFVGAIASQIAGDVENAFLYEELAGQERLRHELQIARQIQMASLPQVTPRVRGLDVAGISIPALEVGGDYFDYLDGHTDRLTVMVGDVSGKGTSAALHMSRLQGIVRSLHGFDLSPRELFVRTNDLISRDLERRSFVTALGGFFDTGSRRAVLVRAGHLPLYHYRMATGDVARVLPRGLGFGLSQEPLFDSELEEFPLAYTPGDVMLFVTDGVTECQNEHGELFGEDRLSGLLSSEVPRQPSATGLRDALAAALQRFAGDTDPYDDQTIVVVRAVP